MKNVYAKVASMYVIFCLMIGTMCVTNSVSKADSPVDTFIVMLNEGEDSYILTDEGYKNKAISIDKQNQTIELDGYNNPEAKISVLTAVSKPVIIKVKGECHLQSVVLDSEFMAVYNKDQDLVDVVDELKGDGTLILNENRKVKTAFRYQPTGKRKLKFDEMLSLKLYKKKNHFSFAAGPSIYNDNCIDFGVNPAPKLECHDYKLIEDYVYFYEDNPSNRVVKNQKVWENILGEKVVIPEYDENSSDATYKVYIIASWGDKTIGIKYNDVPKKSIDISFKPLDEIVPNVTLSEVDTKACARMKSLEDGKEYVACYGNISDDTPMCYYKLEDVVSTSFDKCAIASRSTRVTGFEMDYSMNSFYYPIPEGFEFVGYDYDSKRKTYIMAFSEDLIKIYKEEQPPKTQPPTAVVKVVKNSSVKKPARATITAVKLKKKKLTVKWKKLAGVTGYQIKLSTNKKMTAKTTITKLVKGAKKTSKTFKVRKKKYYVKVRAYVMDGKKRLYGSYSKVKLVK